MKWARVWRVAITSGVIDCPHEGDLPARAQIVEECWSNIDTHLCETVNSVCNAYGGVSWAAKVIDSSLATGEDIALISVSKSNSERSIFIISAQRTQVLDASITETITCICLLYYIRLKVSTHG